MFFYIINPNIDIKKVRTHMETILIVEDDWAYARSTAIWLRKNGINARYVLSVNDE